MACPVRLLLICCRYSIQRLARKINGRVFSESASTQSRNTVLNAHTAINYRLAPQYPFPCAIQDLLAACEYELAITDNILIAQLVDLYLIRPPPGASHTPVSPSNIVFGGDSAGGGLCIATLQVIRDAGLPVGGVDYHNHKQANYACTPRLFQYDPCGYSYSSMLFSCISILRRSE